MEVIKGLSKKAIYKVINSNVNSLCRAVAAMLKDVEEIDRKKFENDLKDDLILTGGSITSMLVNEKINDFDYYFKTRAMATKVAQLYVSQLSTSNEKVSDIGIRDTIDGIEVVIKSAGVSSGDGAELENYEYFESLTPEEVSQYFKKLSTKQREVPYKASLISSNAISLTNNIQFILRFVGEPEVIHKNFDFVHCKNYWTAKTGLVLKQDALEAILAKQLKYSSSRFPICSLLRLRKFIRRGWSISAGEILKICFDINKLDLKDVNVLQEQLTGVDVAYFNQLISLIKADQGNGIDIDDTYIINVIDRVFGDDVLSSYPTDSPIDDGCVEELNEGIEE